MSTLYLLTLLLLPNDGGGDNRMIQRWEGNAAACAAEARELTDKINDEGLFEAIAQCRQSAGQ